MKRFMAFILASFMLFSFPAWAWDTNSGQAVPVGTIELWGDTHVILFLAAAVCNNATSNATVHIVVGSNSGITVTADGVKAMLATLTAAKLAGKNVRIFATSFQNVCYAGAIQLN